MEAIIKERFVQRVLEYQGQRLLKNQGNALYKKLKFHTGRLQSNRTISVVSANDNLDGKLTFRHLDYERFQDMKHVNCNRKGKSKRTSGLRIHNRFIYGHYHAIARQLSVGLTDEIRENLLTELKTEING